MAIKSSHAMEKELCNNNLPPTHTQTDTSENLFLVKSMCPRKCGLPPTGDSRDGASGEYFCHPGRFWESFRKSITSI